jgi:hypothetical protein
MTDQGAGQDQAGRPPDGIEQQKTETPSIPVDISSKRNEPNDLASTIKQGEKWLIFINTLFLLATIVIAFIYYRQLLEMRRATLASEESAYAACVGAQISRSTLIEIQKGGSDTHGAAVASVYQAMAATQAEIAIPTVVFGGSRVQSGESMGFTYQVANQGKTPAIHVDIKIRAVFQPPRGKLDFSYPTPPRLTNIKWGLISAGSIIPTDEQSKVHPLGISVRDDNGRILLAGQSDIDDYNLHRKILIVYGKLTYQDVFGVRHWRTFCYFASPRALDEVTNSGNIQCEEYNKTDKNRVLYRPEQPVTHASAIPEIPCLPPANRRP